MLQYSGAQKGPHVYLQAALHAGEVLGVGVLQSLIEQLKHYTLQGTLTIIPSANPYALDQKAGEYTQGRFDPISGENWNRQFINLWDEKEAMRLIKTHQAVCFESLIDLYRQHLKTCLKEQQQYNVSYGQNLAQILQSLAIDADIAIDLHCDSITVPYAYVPAFAVEDIRYLNMPFIMETSCTFSPCFNESFFYPWWCFTDLYNRLTGQNETCPIRSCTYEIGTKETCDTQNMQQKAQSLIHFLVHMGVLFPKKQEENTKPENIIMPITQFKRVMAPTSGIVMWSCALGEPLEKGSEIARILTPSHIGEPDGAYVTIRAPVPCIPITKTASAIAVEGAELYKYLSLEENEIAQSN